MGRVMEVFHIEDDSMHFDYFPEKMWNKIVNNFFIEGGLVFPEEIDITKSLDELTDNDYKAFFAEIGYTVVAFDDNFSTSKHVKHTIDIPNDQEIGQG